VLTSAGSLVRQLEKLPRADLAAEAAQGEGRGVLLRLRTLIDDLLDGQP
jgi:hypothetical protein